MKYAHYNKEGEILHIFDSMFTENIPTPSIDITDEEWLDILQHHPKWSDRGQFKIRIINERIVKTELEDYAEKVSKRIPFWASGKAHNVNVLFHIALSRTDWKVIRHRDELAMGGDTTISDEAYKEILNKRKSLRTESNLIVEKLKNASSLEELEQIEEQTKERVRGIETAYYSDIKR